jgi:ornithine cyclodeaminase/alanine dehydrogenase-like protein (mu-crystallin family)
MRFYAEDEVRRILPMKAAIDVLRRAFTDFAHGKAKHQPRRRLHLETGAVLHTMTGACGQYFGSKVYATHAKHGAWFTVLLFDAETAKPLAQFEANWLGQIRTGAVSGLAVEVLSPNRPLRVGCIGSGFQAQSQLEAIAAVRQIESVRVWSRREEKRQPFAQTMEGLLGAEVTVAASAADTARAADILVTATWAKDPVLEDADVKDGTLVLAMGSNNPQRRELPAELVRRSIVVVEDKEACRIEAGDLILAFGEDDWNRVVELKDVITNQLPQRTGQTTVFKSVGIGLSDIAVAGWIYEQTI